MMFFYACVFKLEKQTSEFQFSSVKFISHKFKNAKNKQEARADYYMA